MIKSKLSDFDTTPINQANSLFIKRPKNFGIGCALPPKRDLTRFVRWPRYIRIQRQRRIIYQRLKVPPAIAQFRRTLDKGQATALLKLLMKYRPASKTMKKEQILADSEAKAKQNCLKKEKPFVVKFGLNHVTKLIENRTA